IGGLFGKSCPQQTTRFVPDWIAQLASMPAAIACAVPAVPSTAGGGARKSASSPQHTSRPAPASIMQRAYFTEMALAGPSGADGTALATPHQATRRVRARVAPAEKTPVAGAVGCPVGPSTSPEVVACQCRSWPHHTPRPVPAWIAQL